MTEFKEKSRIVLAPMMGLSLQTACKTSAPTPMPIVLLSRNMPNFLTMPTVCRNTATWMCAS